ncbi:MAG: ribonuclease III domain-containing protein [Candidatus Methanoperedens sp.]
MNNKISDVSYLKLKWNIQGVFDDLPIIERELENRLNQLPENNLRETRITKNWIDHIRKINHKIQYIKKYKIIELEKNIGYSFTEPNLVVLSFIQPSIKNIFQEINKSSNINFRINFEPYLKMDEAARVLALIGDAAISLALVQILWQPNISNVGELTKKRAEFASNENLARICDKWDLYDHRIHFDPNKYDTKEKTINHVKGTIVEALFGVIYIENGLGQVISSIVALK